MTTTRKATKQASEAVSALKRRHPGCQVKIGHTTNSQRPCWIWYRRPGRMGWEGYAGDTWAEVIERIEASTTI